MIYFSSLLQTSPTYKPAADRLFAALDLYAIKKKFIYHTKDIWLRDFMPVKTASGRYISFRYEPGYLADFPELRTNYRRDISEQLSLPVTYSSINLDGGNIVFSPSKSKALISDRVFSENPSYGKVELVRELEWLLEAQVIIIPSLKSDMTGHADGMVRFIDEYTVVGNKTENKNGLEQQIKAVLVNHGIEVVDFPFFVSKKHSAVGCYLNFLETETHLFLPVFGIARDDEAIAAVESVFTKPVMPVNICEIARDGGCLNCISWEQ